MSNAEKVFLEEVELFRAWARSSDSEPRFAEWQLDYTQWESIYAAATVFLTAVPVAAWNARNIGALLDIIEADWDIQQVAGSLAQHPDKLLRLAELALHETSHADAKWQLALELGPLAPRSTEAERLLLAFAHDEDEYTRRRALGALAKIDSPHVAGLIEPAWSSGDEYQRMMALFALAKTSSPDLGKYLQMAEADGREYLLAYAAKIRAGQVR